MITSNFWDEALNNLSNPQAISLRSRLNPVFPLGIDPDDSGVTFNKYKQKVKKSSKNNFESITETVLEASLLNPSCLVLVAVGEFYEAYGVHAAVISEITGLRAMGSGGLAKCGTPLGNLHQSVGLITAAGYSAVIIEQADIPGSTRKSRYIAQVVSPENPCYIHAMALDDDRNVDYPASLSIYAVSEDVLGLNCYELLLDNYVLLPYRGLSIDALLALLSKGEGRVAKVILDKRIDIKSEEIISYHLEKMSNIGSWIGRGIKIKSFRNINGESDAITVFKEHLKLDESCKISVSNPLRDSSTRLPLHLTTSEQIGLINSSNVPDLLTAVLGVGAQETSRSIIRRLIHTPPKIELGDKVREVVRQVSEEDVSWPDLNIVSIIKYHRTIAAKEANCHILRELQKCLSNFIKLSQLKNSEGLLTTSSLGISLGHYILGTYGDYESIRLAAVNLDLYLKNSLSDSIPGLVSCSALESLSEHEDISLLVNNLEHSLRGKIREGRDSLLDKLLLDVEQTRNEYLLTILDIKKKLDALQDKGKLRKKNLYQFSLDQRNKQILIKVEKNLESFGELVQAKDRTNKAIDKRFSSALIDKARETYIEAIDKAESRLLFVIKEVNATLALNLKEIISIGQSNNIIKTLMMASEQGLRSNWGLNVTRSKDATISYNEVFPFWINKSEAVLNDVTIDSVGVLFGGNLAGKSTLLRSLLSCALLAEAGLYYPSTAITLPNGGICGYFLRTGATDDAKRNLSGLGVEMYEVSSILKDISYYDQIQKDGKHPVALAFIDEVGKGTDSKHGTALAAAILASFSGHSFIKKFVSVTDKWKYPSKVKIRGLFATHWHELNESPYKKLLNDHRIFHFKFEGDKPTHKLMEGLLIESTAMLAAIRFGLPEALVRLAGSFLADSEPKYIEKIESKCSEEEVNDRDTSSIDDKVLKIFQSYFSNDQKIINVLSDGNMPPLTIMGKSIVYMIKDSRGFYYVGESDDFIRRIRSHYGDKNKKIEWIRYAVKENKTEARKTEKDLISELVAGGFSMLSAHDGRK